MAFIRNTDALIEGSSNKFFTSARAKAAVQSDLDGLQTQINSILSNVDPAALDSLTEIVAAFQSADSSINTAISNLAASASSNLAQEVSDRQAADSAEASTRSSADSALSSRISTLEADPVTKTYVDGQISTEATARANEDLTFFKLDGSRSITGNVLFYSDGVNNIGASAASRPNNIYVKSSIVNAGSESIGTTLTMTGASGANMLWSTDGGGNIGASAANRPANIYAKTSIFGGTVKISSGGGALASNIAIGSNALNSNTTGAQNLIAGVGSAQYSSTSSNITALGYAALQNTSGSPLNAQSVVAIGAFAGQYLNAWNNVAIGASALQGQSATPATGASNTAIGTNSGQYFSTADNNVAIGMNSLQGTASVPNTGRFNTSIGTTSSQYLSSGSYNIAIGYYSLRGADGSPVTGDRNTAIGVTSCVSSTSGYRNTALGYASLYYTTTGNNNIALGYGAGSSLTTGSNNILIGVSVQASSVTASNEINIGGVYKADPSNGIMLNADVVYSGGQKIKYASKSADYTLIASDYCIEYTSLASSKTVTLPSAATVGAGKVYVVKDGTGLASGSNYIRLQANGMETIDGSSYYDINAAYESAMIVSNGSNWILL